MKKLLFLVLILFLFITPIAQAHPGNTASDGCHYCRTNCDKWGEVYGERHCHGGGSAPAVQQPAEVYVAPTNTPVPARVYPTWTPKPTRRPIPTRTPTPTITMTPTPTSTPSPTMKVVKKVTAPTPLPQRNWWDWLFGK